MSFLNSELKKSVSEYLNSEDLVIVPLYDEEEEEIDNENEIIVEDIKETEQNEKEYHYLNNDDLSIQFGFDRDLKKKYLLNIFLYQINKTLEKPFLEFYLEDRNGTYQFLQKNIDPAVFKNVAVEDDKIEEMHIPEPVPVPVPVTVPVHLPVIEPSPVPAEEPIPDPVEEPVPEKVEEPIPAPVEEPVPEKVEEPIPDPVEEPILAPVIEPSPVPAEEPVPAPVIEPVPEPVEEPIPDPVEEPIPDPVEEPIPDPVEEPIIAPVIEPVPEPVEEPIPAPLEEPIPEPVEEPVPELVEEPIPAPVEEPIPAPVEEPVQEPLQEKLKEPSSISAEKPPNKLEEVPQVKTTGGENENQDVEEIFLSQCSDLININFKDLQTNYKGYIEIEDIIYVVYENVGEKIKSRPGSQLALLHEITTTKKIINNSVNESVVDLFENEPILLNLKDDDNNSLENPVVLYLCKNNGNSYETVVVSDSSTEEIDTQINHEVFGNVYLFTQEPIPTVGSFFSFFTGAKKVKRYAGFLDQKTEIENGEKKLSDFMKERNQTSFTYENYSCIRFKENGLNYWAVKSKLLFTVI